jgi:hypothetical protein
MNGRRERGHNGDIFGRRHNFNWRFAYSEFFQKLVLYNIDPIHLEDKHIEAVYSSFSTEIIGV